MRTKGLQENFRVVVTPRSLGDFGSIRMSNSLLYGNSKAEQERAINDMRDRCAEIAEAVRRHADNVGRVDVEFDQEYICEHCGSRWSEEAATYNGGCCDKDEEGATEGDAA